MSIFQEASSTVFAKLVDMDMMTVTPTQTPSFTPTPSCTVTPTPSFTPTCTVTPTPTPTYLEYMPIESGSTFYSAFAVQEIYGYNYGTESVQTDTDTFHDVFVTCSFMFNLNGDAPYGYGGPVYVKYNGYYSESYYRNISEPTESMYSVETFIYHRKAVEVYNEYENNPDGKITLSGILYDRRLGEWGTSRNWEVRTHVYDLPYMPATLHYVYANQMPGGSDWYVHFTYFGDDNAVHTFGPYNLGKYSEGWTWDSGSNRLKSNSTICLRRIVEMYNGSVENTHIGCGTPDPTPGVSPTQTPTPQVTPTCTPSITPSNTPTPTPAPAYSYFLVAKKTGTSTNPNHETIYEVSVSYKNSFGIVKDVYYKLNSLDGWEMLQGQFVNVNWTFDYDNRYWISNFAICVSEIVENSLGDLIPTTISCVGD